MLPERSVSRSHFSPYLIMGDLYATYGTTSRITMGSWSSFRFHRFHCDLRLKVRFALNQKLRPLDVFGGFGGFGWLESWRWAVVAVMALERGFEEINLHIPIGNARGDRGWDVCFGRTSVDAPDESMAFKLAREDLLLCTRSWGTTVSRYFMMDKKRWWKKPWKATLMVVLNSEFLPLLGFPSGEIETGMIGGTACYEVQKEVTMCLSLRVACLGFYNCLISVSSRFLGRWRCRVSCDMIMICLKHSRKIYRHMCALWSYEHIYSTVHNYESVISYLMPHQAFEVPIEMY